MNRLKDTRSKVNSLSLPKTSEHYHRINFRLDKLHWNTPYRFCGACLNIPIPRPAETFYIFDPKGIPEQGFEELQVNLLSLDKPLAVA
jgi:hypothetical protein